MIEPTIWMQLGITEERYRAINKEIESILKTDETTGNLILLVKGSSKLQNDEKYYAIYMIAKSDIIRKLAKAMPPGFGGVIRKIMEG